MNSTERKEARYQRRKAAREAKCKSFTDELGTFEDIFSFINLYNAFHICKKGVRWKASIQAYETNLPVNSYDLYRRLKAGTWKSKGFTKFKLSERGKVRLIQSVHISERCIQRTLCDMYLVPLLSRSLIYDNGASLKGKGMRFAIDRIRKHLRQHQREHGDEGYILLYDFTNYFGNISHEKLYGMIDSKITDDRIRILFHQLIDAFDEGLGLGSQVSQICAVYFANRLDHTFKDKLGICKYARYMDDGYIISHDIEFLHDCERTLFDLCKELDIKISPKKIRICKLTHGFTFLKKRFRLRKGKIEMKISRSSFKAVRRRLKKMKEKNLPPRDIWNSYNSWRGTLKDYDNFYMVKRMDEYYNHLFLEDFMKGDEYGRTGNGIDQPDAKED